LNEGGIPKKALDGALHVAVAHGIDLLLTWNCRHIANPEIQRGIAEQLEKIGLFLLFICTPEELLGEKMLSDEIIDEVQSIRDAHAAKFNYDLRAIYADLKKTETERIAAGHPFVFPLSEIPAPKTVLQITRFVRR
jgi:hypothetical protein